MDLRDSVNEYIKKWTEKLKDGLSKYFEKPVEFMLSDYPDEESPHFMVVLHHKIYRQERTTYHFNWLEDYEEVADFFKEIVKELWGINLTEYLTPFGLEKFKEITKGEY